MQKRKADFAWAWEDDPFGVFWAVRPIVRDMLQTQGVFPTCHADIVVHFRCSDVPFCRSQYTLMRVGWFVSALRRAGAGPGTRVCFLMCSSHQPEICTQNATRAKRACSAYAAAAADAIATVVGKENVETRCEGPVQDFAAMVSARRLLLSTGSSMSFMAALARDPSQMSILPLPARRAPYTVLSGRNHTSVPPESEGLLLLPAERILHSEVPDYFDIAHVLRLFQTPGTPCVSCMSDYTKLL
eukprot:Hpha_TRINITY_DN3983_c0_g1::TRINITY_DN3983_c0_g1_i1::g.17958::m.17958